MAKSAKPAAAKPAAAAAKPAAAAAKPAAAAAKPAAEKPAAAKKPAAGKKPLSKSALYAHLSEKTGLKKTEIQQVFDVLTETIKTQLAAKGAGKLVIPGIARLTVRKVKAVKGGEKKINPLTKQEYETKPRPAFNKVSLRPVKSLAESLK